MWIYLKTSMPAGQFNKLPLNQLLFEVLTWILWSLLFVTDVDFFHYHKHSTETQNCLSGGWKCLLILFCYFLCNSLKRVLNASQTSIKVIKVVVSSPGCTTSLELK